MDEVPGAVWHATPLHYLPSILAARRLLAQSCLPTGVRPRPRPAARLRRLGLTGYVFFSLHPVTPLLVDKRRRGYPHALLEFDPALGLRPGTAMARYNTRAWAHRELFAPVTDPTAQAELLRAHRRGRYPSLELLQPESVPLEPFLRTIHLATPAERDWLAGMAALTESPTPRMIVAPERFPGGPDPDLSALLAWGDACRVAGRLLAPPELPFD